MGLTSKQAKFVEAYKKLGNGPQSAISAGYSAKTSQIEAIRLLKNPKILLELDNWRKSKAAEITKADFVDIAMDSFKQLEITEPNSPRFLDLAGKALGHIGSGNETRQQTINNLTQININGGESQSELWELTRKLLGNE